MSARLKVLHIAGWLPSPDRPGFAPFVQRQIASVEPLVDQEVWHLEVERGDRLRILRSNPAADRTLKIWVPTKRFLVLECIAQLGFLALWLTRSQRKFDLVHFHIAYPNCILLNWTRWVLGRVPIVITEHWSGYHFGFNSSGKGLDRIRSVFCRGDDLICVSRALHQDIASFAGCSPPHPYVIPNVVSPTFHHSNGARPVEGRFLFVGNLSFPKRPDVLIEVMAQLVAMGRKPRLVVVGDGARREGLEEQVRRAGLRSRVEFVGRLEPDSLNEEYRRGHALLHCSDYETFSVVCAEAACCGVPVVASRVGGIPEVLTERDILVDSNKPAEWAALLHAHWDGLVGASREPDEFVRTRFGPEAIGSLQLKVYRQILDAKRCRTQKRVARDC